MRLFFAPNPLGRVLPFNAIRNLFPSGLLSLRSLLLVTLSDRIATRSCSKWTTHGQGAIKTGIGAGGHRHCDEMPRGGNGYTWFWVECEPTRKVRFSKAHWLSSIFAGRWKYLCGASRGLEQKSKRITREGIELNGIEGWSRNLKE